MMFDIMLPGVSDGTVMHHTSVAAPKPIKPYSLKVPGTSLSEPAIQACQLCILLLRVASEKGQRISEICLNDE